MERKGAKMIGIGFKFLCSGDCKTGIGVGEIVANWLMVRLWELRGLMIE